MFEASLTRSIAINEFGYVKVSDKVVLVNKGNRTENWSAFKVQYPGVRMDQKVTLSGKGEFATASKKVEGNSTILTIQPLVGVEVAAKGNKTITILVYIADLIKEVERNTYRVILPGEPQTDLKVEKPFISVNLPLKANFTKPPVGFGKGRVSGLEYWELVETKAIKGNVTLVVEMSAGEENFVLADFQESAREVFVTPSEVTVRETLRGVNRSNGTLANLRVNALTSLPSNVTVLSTQDPPLRQPSSKQIRTLPNYPGSLDLKNIFPNGWGAQSVLQLRYEYGVKGAYVKVEGDLLRIEIPASSIVDALVRKNSVKVHSDYFALEGEAAVVLEDASPVTEAVVKVTAKPSFTLGALQATPLGLILLVASFVFTAATKVKGKEGDELWREVRKVAVEKATSVQELLLGIEEKDRFTRRDYDRIKSSMDEVVERATQRLPELRAKLLERRPEAQDALAGFASADREFDAAASSVLSLLRQVASGRQRSDSFRRLGAAQFQRLADARNRLDDVLDRIQKGVEV